MKKRKSIKPVAGAVSKLPAPKTFPLVVLHDALNDAVRFSEGIEDAVIGCDVDTAGVHHIVTVHTERLRELGRRLGEYRAATKQ